ncbi:MAG: NTP transferase domain-containing protein, partial [Rhodobacteraceae bacterium]|nr:NTP transferase domain-containing protein [Paracoccaceae bacterium]
HVLDAAAAVGARRCVVITGHGATEVEAFATSWARAGGQNHAQVELQSVRQEPQLGTGHAVQQAEPLLPGDGVTLVLNGDVPLVQPDTLRRLIALCEGEHLALLTVDSGEDAGAYGRIVRAAAGADGDIPVRAIV